MTYRISTIAGLTALALLTITPFSFADKGPKKSTLAPDAALEKLMAGNARYSSGSATHPNQNKARRSHVAKGQAPFAVIVGCSDSRTSPEILFDQGLGDIFVTRLAGNIVDDAALGSIEFAVAVLGARVIVVTGHEKCGAVDAALNDAKVPGKIGTVLKPIKPAIAKLKKSGTATLDGAIEANAKHVAAGLADRSKILADKIKAGELKVVAANYDLDTGKVTLLN